MAGRGRGLASNQGHASGPGVGLGGQGPGGEERRELRRPIVGQPGGPSAEDITRGMAKMEPYRDDYGRFGGYGGPHGGGQPGMGPPRPAPNADGWSSGENQFGQQHYQNQWNPMMPQNLNGAHQQFHPQQNHFGASHHDGGQSNFNEQNINAQNHAAGWNFNIGASEFVPKNSNLSVAAQEFVPRHIPRNTSYWAQQQQQQQQQQQELIYQQHNQYELDQNQAYPPEHNFNASGIQPDYNQIPSNAQQSHHQGKNQNVKCYGKFLIK